MVYKVCKQVSDLDSLTLNGVPLQNRACNRRGPPNERVRFASLARRRRQSDALRQRRLKRPVRRPPLVQ